MTERPAAKSADAYRTIGEVAEELNLPQHVLRFWETRFTQVRPLKRGGGRRFYRPEDVALLRAVQTLLYGEGYTIKGVQRLLKEFGAQHVADALARSTEGVAAFTVHRAARSATSGAAAGGGVAAVPRDGGTAPPRPPASPRTEARADAIERLEKALADMVACGELLASLRSRR